MVPISNKDAAKYSILSALAVAVGNNCSFDSGLELDISNEIARRTKRPPQGLYVPLSMLATRALTLSAGAGSVAHVTDSQAISALTPLSILGKAGAVFIDGLHGGSVAFPAEASAAGVTWVAEGSGPSGTAPSMTTGVAFTPRTATGNTTMTRAFINQTSIAAEDWARRSLLRSMAAAIDTAAINGAGGLEPDGLLGMSGLNVVATTSHLPGWANIVRMEANVSNANSLLTAPAYITSPNGVNYLKTTPKVGTTFPKFLAADGKLNGYQLLGSNVVPSNLGGGANQSALVFADWNDYTLATWGCVDLLVDRYTLGTTGGVKVNVFATVDAKPTRLQSFSVITDFLAL